MHPMQHIEAVVQSNNRISEGYYELRFVLPEGSTAPVPGQFLTIRVSSGNVPLLRRPFAFSRWDEDTGTAGIIYQKRGSATAMLSAAVSGDTLDILSPLGNSFPLPSAVDPPPAPRSGNYSPKSDAGSHRRPVLLAGGIGMGPMFFFQNDLIRRGRNPLLLLGARSASLIPDTAPLTSGEVVCATDDGSLADGFSGNILEALEEYLGHSGDSPDTYELYACGPHAMMKAAWDWASARAIPLWVSMEQTMGCAVGACMGCVVPVNDESRYARVCKEGPIFPGGYISWH